ncbi:hypothetical protein C7212DRAFT_159360 [Tuber magnatum]|uniref:Uncharacterized protein n=1 Tax=Tuber magnatum TaxID=42249 RepID=A0A317T427_9PEZI|nr:hypothetical protein C7212DRAFT_159360 [Tuber magnatum]
MGNTNPELRDRLVALKGIQKNTKALDGDPRKVTVWGEPRPKESEGAYSMGSHLLPYCENGDGLYRAFS